MAMKKLLFALILIVGCSSVGMAGLIPYGNIGTEAPANSFTALNDGLITAYFYASDAGYDSQIGMWVNGVSTGIYGLPNHSTAYGTALVLGPVAAGDIIEFELLVAQLGNSWFSDPIHNGDGFNHAYATPFSGDLTIPVGRYVGFEDLPGGGDVDYNDHQFVFTNVDTTPPVPEPATVLLLGTGLLGLGLVASRRRKSVKA